MMPAVQEFGIAFESPSVRDFIAAAKVAEALGFGTFWLPEDPVFPGAFATASAIASNTRKIKIGIGVLNPWTRHPVQTAMELAALDDISEGRAVLGLGASVKLWIEDQLGIPYTRPVTALRETVAILNGLLCGERLDHNGRSFKANGVRASFDLPGRHVPIYLGVMAPRALALAGEVADGVLLNSIVTPDFVRGAIDQISLGTKRSGRTLDGFSVGAYFTLAMSSDERSARDAVKPYIAMILGALAGQPQLPVFSHTGISPEAARRFAEALLTGQLAVDLVTDSIIDAMAIAGSPARCRERLAELVAAGVTSPTIFLPPQSNFAQSARDVVTYLFPHFP
jgi:5,10-methylenetetrahydromethanopterin reductase